MPVSLTVRLQGLDQALAALDRQSGRSLERRVVLGLRTGAQMLVAPIRAQAPKRTGYLARSVTAKSGRGGAVTVGPRAWYRHFVIRGTRRGVRPNPFVDRAVDANLESVKDRVADIILRGRR